MIHELFLRHEPPDALEQHFEHAEFARGQVYDLLADMRDASDLVERQRTMLHDSRTATRAASRQRSNARFELVEREGFGHIVIGAEVESLHAFVDTVGRRQDQNRHLRIACAQAAQHLQTGHERQAEIENQEVESLQRKGGICLDAMLHMVDGVSRLAE